MSKEFASVPYSLPVWSFYSGGCFVYTAWHMKMALVTKCYLMSQTGQTMGPHLPHHTPGINFTISLRGNMTPRLAIGGDHPPKATRFVRPATVLSSHCTSSLKGSKNVYVNTTSFLYRYGTLRPRKELCHTKTMLCASLKIKWSFKPERIWGFSIRKTFFAWGFFCLFLKIKKR